MTFNLPMFFSGGLPMDTKPWGSLKLRSKFSGMSGGVKPAQCLVRLSNLLIGQGREPLQHGRGESGTEGVQGQTAAVAALKLCFESRQPLLRRLAEADV